MLLIQRSCPPLLAEGGLQFWRERDNPSFIRLGVLCCQPDKALLLVYLIPRQPQDFAPTHSGLVGHLADRAKIVRRVLLQGIELCGFQDFIPDVVLLLLLKALERVLLHLALLHRPRENMLDPGKLTVDGSKRDFFPAFFQVRFYHFACDRCCWRPFPECRKEALLDPGFLTGVQGLALN